MEKVRNPKYSNADNSMIDLEININGEWLPFSASPDDPEKYGPMLYEKAVSGEFGKVEPYAGGE